MKVLFTTPVLDFPPAGGPALRIANSIKALNKVSELHIISRVPKVNMGGDRGEEFYKRHCYKFLYSKGNISYSSGRLIKKMKRKIFENFLKWNDVDHIISYADRNGIQIIWFGYGNVSHQLMKSIHEKRPDLKLVCDTDSVWSRFILREIPYIKDENRKKQVKKEGEEKQKEESEWVKFCNITTGASEIDLAYYRNLAVDKSKVALFEIGIDLDYYKTIPEPPRNFHKNSFCLVGSFYPLGPMEHAARWVINEVLPILRKKIPDFHFYIVGNRSDAVLADIVDPNITITGRVETVLPYLGNSKVSIVPHAFESGTRVKIFESGAIGTPMVSTTLGAEGIPVTHNKDIIIADDKESFAQGIVDLMTNAELAKKMAENCKILVNNFGINMLVKQANQILQKLENKPTIN